jgi:HD superfamily phosphohydrolase YqeK
LTPELKAMTRRGLDLVTDPAERAELRAVVDSVAEQAFERWLRRRTADDNRVEHEFVVFGAAMRIAEAERLPLTGKLVVTCATFLHDTFPIQRITERAIREAEARDRDLAASLREAKARQRIEHMEGGARNADILLRELVNVSLEVRERCAAIIASHDYWKLGKPHPAGSDREALVCFEADALWPLHPLGVLADLERPGEDGEPKDVNDPAEWRRQVRNNLQTLREYRANWQRAEEMFQDPDSIFRTAEGHRLYREWTGLWGL